MRNTPNFIVINDFPFLDVSSTEIRNNLDNEYLDLLRQYHTDISNNLKVYTEKKINRNDYEVNRTKIKENFCKEKNKIT